MTDWHTREWLHMGLADVELQPDGTLLRRLYQPYADCLRSWQQRLKRVTALDEDPYDKAVDLADIIAAARELRTTPDANWH